MEPGSVFRLMTVLFAGVVTSSTHAADFFVDVRETVSPDDDYICWTPVKCRIRISQADADVPVTITSKTLSGPDRTGVVQFQSAIPNMNRTGFSPSSSLNLTIPKTSLSAEFFVAGKTESTDGKDVVIEVKTSDGTVVLEHPLMVRVRKNAERLSKIEIKRFLEALAKLHDLQHAAASSKYFRYVIAHTQPFGQLHGFPSFPPWHRVFILSLERDLQAIDARVALPYWKFEDAAPKIFSKDFLGEVDESLPLSDPDRFVVQFSDTNPIKGWGMLSSSGNLEPMVRVRNASQASSLPNVDFAAVISQPTLADMWLPLEEDYHNTAHSHVSGWLSTAASPRDPLFFLLHANVDRAWAQWQEGNGVRFNVAPVNAPANHPAREAYEPIDSYPGFPSPPAIPDPDRLFDGQYLRDSMWPWNNKGGLNNPLDPRDNWPTGVFDLPPKFPTNSVSVPHLMDTIDYAGVNDATKSLGFSYDDLPYKP